MGTRIFFKAEKVPVHLLSDVGIELAEVSCGGASDFNAVCQDSVSEFSHEVTERNSPLDFRLFQGGSRIFEVDSVHFLLGQAL
jgi:hypothetical protein